MSNFKSKFVPYLIAVSGAASLILLSPLFEVSDVIVLETSRISRKEILETVRLDQAANIFAFNSSKARRNLLQDIYIDDVFIKKDYFNRDITIDVRERTLSGYVYFKNDTYLHIDQNGRVLDVTSIISERLPIVVGLDFSDFIVGNILSVDNPNSFNNVVTLAAIFDKYDMEADFIKIDVSKDDNISLYTDNLSVSLGDIRDADEKIRTLKVIMQDLQAKNLKGFLDIREVNSAYSFKILS